MKRLLFPFSLFLLAFIPLYPKIPLFDILPGYIVRVRVEDLLLVLASGLWFWHALKNRQMWKNGYLGFVGIYALGGLLSIALGVFLLQTIPLELLHVGKSALHYFRYLEYFALFFIVFSGVTTKQHARVALFVLAGTTFLVTLYGMGQKFWHFPLYSTMNREYSKGQAFYLEAGGKVSSTFGGHYDLAAFLVIVLPLLFSFSLVNFGRTKKQLLIFAWLQLTHLAGVWLLTETGSKTALVAYLFALAVVTVLSIQRIVDKRVRLWLTSAAIFSVSLMLLGFLTLFGTKIKARFSDLFYAILQTKENAGPVDLVGDGYEWKSHTTTSPDGVVTTTRELEKSIWSPNALRYGISMGIRLDTLWPQAIKGLSNNPLFGSGYGTLSKLENAQFTEADSTDNNYLRTLGETGLVGFICFYGFILLSMRLVKRNLSQHTGVLAALSIGYLGASVGLLINALYIDVFAASKVAFIFWGLTGATLSLVAREEGNIVFHSVLKHLTRHKTLYVTICLTFFLLQQNPLATKSQLNAFDSSTKAFENFVAARCFSKQQTFTLCRDSGLLAENGFSAYSLLLIPFVWLSQNPTVFYYLNFLVVLGTLLFVYKKIGVTSLVGLLFIVTMAYESGFTRAPLEDSQLFRLVVLAPIALWLLQKFILQGKHARLARAILLASFLFVPLVHPGFSQEFVENFRNAKQVTKRDAVLQANANLLSSDLQTPNASNFLITALSPYYIDLYSNQQYQVLPLSAAQTYMDHPNNVWGTYDFADLTALYVNLLAQGNRLFLADYGVATAQPLFDDFATLRKNFDVRYSTIDCYDECALYSVATLSDKISPLPTSITAQQLRPAELPPAYTFVVLSNRFEPNAVSGVPHNLLNFLKKLAPLKSAELAFLVISGDVLDTHDTSAIPLFNAGFADQANYPILYNSGNYDLLPKKPYAIGSERFYTKRDYFLMLNLGADATASNEQRLFAFNALLELEQLPNIKNLFIISHDLNWQDTSNPKNFMHQLETKLVAFPNLHTYILTTDHGKGEQLPYKQNGNLTYQANSVVGRNTNTFVTVRVDSNGSVSIQQEKL